MLTAEGIRALNPVELGNLVASLEAWTGERVTFPSLSATPQRLSSVSETSTACCSVLAAPATYPPVNATDSTPPGRLSPVTPVLPTVPPKDVPPTPTRSGPSAKAKVQPKAKSNRGRKTHNAAEPGTQVAALRRKRQPPALKPPPDTNGHPDEGVDQDPAPSSPFTTTTSRLLFVAPVTTASEGSGSSEAPAPRRGPTWAFMESA
ncbi:hypothetical protein CcaverHIS002_0702330 [Cutaneotrichosporon cavernicola]|uniref:Uncharacterized protein n=1 Tax=Cutaneotrichosporon cavernicola TaxID=279322 RepID=A0AA48L9W9_9TREE|nr:uncharacterized protein CcaverHIS019_0702430 [Cutaneotrichosporon cavernicola]BEI86887.1 hypothetical protein CcaverHIS002_0702330 [Cutaneotrichosporon cavernicola]BEI94662.1 hypothetical protein CcaverHIS019_0702430 [Cutaneotrichosporon cavernicola]BEJ02437.1 hypothetical protein CcaverHIS631_0702320 [Cutaneotrichosporon cavernicola]BEJ10196.1 hypothetical protein CcaverHIS641_0702310 [Cutaneotrichosporon cavernicola]